MPKTFTHVYTCPENLSGAADPHLHRMGNPAKSLASERAARKAIEARRAHIRSMIERIGAQQQSSDAA